MKQQPHHALHLLDPTSQPEFGLSQAVPPRSMDGLIQLVFEKQRLDLIRASLCALEEFKHPTSDSPALRDQKWAREHEHSDKVSGAFAMGAEAVAKVLQSAEQHLIAARAILRSETRIPIPALTCIRAVHEAVLMVCHLTDPAIVPAERLTRAAAGFLASIHGGIPVLAELQGTARDPRQMATAVKSLDGAIEFFEGIGIRVHRKKTGTPLNVRYGDHVANLVPKSADLSKKYAPSLNFMYSLNSGAAHSQPWLLEGVGGSWDSFLRGAALPILDLSDTLAETLLGYCGITDDPYRQATHTRRIAVFSSGPPTTLWVDWATYKRDLGKAKLTQRSTIFDAPWSSPQPRCK